MDEAGIAGVDSARPLAQETPGPSKGYVSSPDSSSSRSYPVAIRTRRKPGDVAASQSVLYELRAWVDDRRGMVAPQSPLERALGYLHREWNRLFLFLEAPDVTTARGRRDRAMLFVMYSAGLRVSELVNLRTADLNRRRGVLRALGKGNKRRLIPLGERAIDEVEAYPPDRAQHPASAHSSILFLSPRGKALSRQAFFNAR